MNIRVCWFLFMWVIHMPRRIGSLFAGEKTEWEGRIRGDDKGVLISTCYLLVVCRMWARENVQTGELLFIDQRPITQGQVNSFGNIALMWNECWFNTRKVMWNWRLVKSKCHFCWLKLCVRQFLRKWFLKQTRNITIKDIWCLTANAKKCLWP